MKKKNEAEKFIAYLKNTANKINYIITKIENGIYPTEDEEAYIKQHFKVWDKYFSYN